MEVSPQETDAPAPAVHYPREGLLALSLPPAIGKGRGTFTLSNGKLIAVVGSSVYAIGVDWNFTFLGTISSLTTPVSVSDNGTTAVLVDGTVNGYQFPIAAPTAANWGPVVDGTGTFVGSYAVDFSDTYLAFSAPNTNEWYLTDSNAVTFNALVTANKDSKPDHIVNFKFNIRQAWLLGTESTEVWFLTGGTPFPYQSWPNVFIPYGCAAPYSLVQADVDLFWISRNAQGQAIAVKSHSLGVEAFTTRALEYEWSGYQTVADCIGGTYQIAGHTFVIFHFPTADKTWAYDLASKQWHRRTWTDTNGVPHRERVSFYASVGPDGGYPRTIVGQDWQTGQLYKIDPQTYTDNGNPIVCRRSFPHQMMDLREVTHVAFVADFATGGASGLSEAPSGPDFNPDFNTDFNTNAVAPTPWVTPFPALCMRYSKDGGKTWSNYRQKRLIASGYYRSMMRFRGLGMGRDWVFELQWVYPGPSALQGAYAEPMVHGA